MVFISELISIIIRNNTLSTNKIHMIYDLFLSQFGQFFARKRSSFYSFIYIFIYLFIYLGGRVPFQRPKTNELQYISLLVSGSIKKLFSIFFFNRFCSVEQCGYTPHCLYHDSLTLKFTFTNISKFFFNISCLLIASKKQIFIT